MTHDAAFHRAILENPNDDLPRLIYADWLEERGDPRADFIRVQCELAGMAADDERRPPLERRERELLERHQFEWLGPLRRLLSGWTFRRGFLDTITVPAAVYLRHTTFPRPITVRGLEVDLDGFVAPPSAIELVPESVARENVCVPVGLRGKSLVIAGREPADADLVAKLQFILNRDVELIAAGTDQVEEAIERHYGQAEIESVTTTCFTEPDHGFETDVADDDPPIARLVGLIIAEAVDLHAEQVRIEPRPECIQVLYRIGQKWVERDTPPRRLLDAVITRLRVLAGLESVGGTDEQAGRVSGTCRGMAIELDVRITPTDAGPSVTLIFLTSAAEGGTKTC